jgi:agmatinase
MVLARELSVIDYGDVPIVPGYIEESYEKLKEGLEPGIS